MRDLGFRCLDATRSTLLDGSEVTIKANSYESSRERPDDTARQRRAFKLYTLTYSNGEQEPVDELTLEARLGTEAFNRLPR